MNGMPLMNGMPYRDGDARNLLLALVANGWIMDNPEETVKHPLKMLHMACHAVAPFEISHVARRRVEP